MKKAKNILVLLLAAVLLISALSLTASAETVTRIDEFRFAANSNAIALRSNETVGVWLNNLKNANNGADSGILARYTSGWSGYDKYFVPKVPVG